MYDLSPIQNHEIDKEIFGKLTKGELLILDFMLEQAAWHSSMKSHDGSFPWTLAGMSELAALSGRLHAFLEFV